VALPIWLPGRPARRQLRAPPALSRDHREVEGGIATEGGRGSGEADSQLPAHQRQWPLEHRREYERQGALLESERDIIRIAETPGVDVTQFRTLLPQTEQASLGGTFNRTILGDVSATLNARLDATDGESLFGLPTGTTDPDGVRPLTRDTRTRSGRLGFALNGTEARWRWSLTGSYDRSENRTLTDVNSLADPRGRDRSESENSFGTIEAVANGPLFELPAGNVTTSLRAGFDTRDLRQ
jgi:hypothetical protein